MGLLLKRTPQGSFEQQSVLRGSSLYYLQSHSCSSSPDDPNGTTQERKLLPRCQASFSTEMVDLEHPSNESIAPSEDIPQLTINHDVAADLDSSNAFEGM